MTVSNKQLTANRRNALKSTGPRTPEGKAASSMNAVRHGLFSHALLIPGEDPAEFEDFAQGMLSDLRPEGVLETSIATRIVGTAWRLRRASLAESAIFSPDPPDFPSTEPAHGVRSSNQKLLTPSHPKLSPTTPSASNLPNTPPPSPTHPSTPSSHIAPPNPGAAYLRRLRPGADPLGGLSRHEARLHRQNCRDLRELESARDLRLKREREACRLALQRARESSDPLFDPFDRESRNRYLEALRHRRPNRSIGQPGQTPETPDATGTPPVLNASNTDRPPEPETSHPRAENGFVSGKKDDPMERSDPKAPGLSSPISMAGEENGFVSGKNAGAATTSEQNAPDRIAERATSFPETFPRETLLGIEREVGFLETAGNAQTPC